MSLKGDASTADSDSAFQTDDVTAPPWILPGSSIEAAAVSAQDKRSRQLGKHKTQGRGECGNGASSCVNCERQSAAQPPSRRPQGLGFHSQFSAGGAVVEIAAPAVLAAVRRRQNGESLMPSLPISFPRSAWGMNTVPFTWNGCEWTPHLAARQHAGLSCSFG